MKLIFLCKRRPMGRDLIERPYGRFFHLPRLLATYGHDVHVALLSYRRDPPVTLERDGVRWHSASIRSMGKSSYLRLLRNLVEEVRPDWIGGFSDTYYGILAQRLARKFATRSLVDAYDNYEGYIPWCKPLHSLWRGAVSRATAISVAGPSLAALLGANRDPRTILVARMAADPLGYRPLPRDDCRQALGLPASDPLVGYFGAIAPSRGIDVLFRALAALRSRLPRARLVLSGRLDRRVRLPPDVIFLGYLPDEKMPLLLNSMNVLTVINQPSAFGNYSHPVKLYEAMSCQLPAVASRTPSTEWILGARADLLSAPGDAEDLARKIVTASSRERIDYGPGTTWEDVALELHRFLEEGRLAPA